MINQRKQSIERKPGYIFQVQHNCRTEQDQEQNIVKQNNMEKISKKKILEVDQNPQMTKSSYEKQKQKAKLTNNPSNLIQNISGINANQQNNGFSGQNSHSKHSQKHYRITNKNKSNHQFQQQKKHISPQQTPDLNINDRFNTQMIRVQVKQYCRTIEQLFNFQQPQLVDFMQTFEVLPHSPINVKSLMTSQNCKLIKTQNQKIYFGETQNKKKHGLGIAIYRDNRAYEGNFVNNLKQGFGVQVYNNQNLYIGKFNQNKRCGQGTFFWFCLSSIPCTSTAQITIQHYKGNWWGGLPDGHGQHYRANGDIYIGSFKNGLKHGKGLQYYFNKDVYEGMFVNGLAQGYGQFVWKNGSYYQGDFKQGYRNGYGIWVNKRGDHTFKGHYMLDKKHGYGMQMWGNGYCYKGEYVNDQRSGKGVLFYREQIVFQGDWQKGQRIILKRNPSKGSKRKIINTTSSFTNTPTGTSKIRKVPSCSDSGSNTCGDHFTKSYNKNKFTLNNKLVPKITNVKIDITRGNKPDYIRNDTIIIHKEMLESKTSCICRANCSCVNNCMCKTQHFSQNHFCCKGQGLCDGHVDANIESRVNRIVYVQRPCSNQCCQASSKKMIRNQTANFIGGSSVRIRKAKPNNKILKGREVPQEVHTSKGKSPLKRPETSSNQIYTDKLIFKSSDMDKTPEKRNKSTQDKFYYSVKRYEKSNCSRHGSCTACAEGFCKTKPSLSRKLESSAKQRSKQKIHA